MVGDSSTADCGISVYRAEIPKDVLQIPPPSTAPDRGRPPDLQNSNAQFLTRREWLIAVSAGTAFALALGAFGN